MVQTNLAIMYDHVCMYFECSSFTIIIQFLHKFGFIRQIAIGIRDNLPTNTVAVKHTDPCHPVQNRMFQKLNRPAIGVAPI